MRGRQTGVRNCAPERLGKLREIGLGIVAAARNSDLPRADVFAGPELCCPEQDVPDREEQPEIDVTFAF
jgi:hypothetical protein